jgi:hypothetical protein
MPPLYQRMSSTPSQAERRQTARYEATGLSVLVRPKGKLTTLDARALDFNRYGIAVHTSQPLTREQPVYLSLGLGDVRVNQLVGIVHNCVRQGERYRCGIRFRLSSGLQRDRQLTERRLSCLEAAVLAALRSTAI